MEGAVDGSGDGRRAVHNGGRAAARSRGSPPAVHDLSTGLSTACPRVSSTSRPRSVHRLSTEAPRAVHHLSTACPPVGTGVRRSPTAQRRDRPRGRRARIPVPGSGRRRGDDLSLERGSWRAARGAGPGAARSATDGRRCPPVDRRWTSGGRPWAPRWTSGGPTVDGSWTTPVDRQWTSRWTGRGRLVDYPGTGPPHGRRCGPPGARPRCRPQPLPPALTRRDLRPQRFSTASTPATTMTG